MQNHRVLSQSVFVVAFGRAVETTSTTQHTTFHTFSESGVSDSVSSPLLHAHERTVYHVGRGCRTE